MKYRRRTSATVDAVQYDGTNAEAIGDFMRGLEGPGGFRIGKDEIEYWRG